MKKILMFLLTVLLVVSTTACAPQPPATEPSQQSELSAPTGENSSPNDSTEFSEWKTKDVTPPTLTQPETETIVALTANGQDIIVNRIISPFSGDVFDLNTAKTLLEKDPLFAGYEFGIHETENGTVTLYSDVGQQTSYRYIHSIRATRDYENTDTYFSDLWVSYGGETSWCNGWSDISVDINFPENVVISEIQDSIYQTLCSVFGEEYAEFLCYAPATEDNQLRYEIEFDNCRIVFYRSLYGNSTDFSIKILSKLQNRFKSYAGDYKPVLGTPKEFFDIFSEEIGEMDMNNYASIASKMLKENFEGYIQTVPDSGYCYRVLTGNNGHKVIEFEFEGAVEQQDVGSFFFPKFDIEYTIVLNGDEVVYIEGELQVPIGQVDAKQDQDSTVKDFLEKGLTMIDCMFDEELNLSSDIYYNTPEDKNNKAVRNLTILGLNQKVTFEIICQLTVQDTCTGHIKIKF